MELITSNVKSRRSWLSPRRTVTFTVELSNSVAELSRLAFELYGAVSRIAPEGTTVKNLKGKNDELFRFSGVIPSDEDDMQKKEGMHFEFTINSHFESQREPGTFLHSIEERSIGDIPQEVNPPDLTWLAPVYPRELHVSIEQYAPHYFSVSLGFGPTIREWITITSSPERTILNTSAELNSLASPLSNELLWDGVCRSFLKTGGVDLRQLFKKDI